MAAVVCRAGDVQGVVSLFDLLVCAVASSHCVLRRGKRRFCTLFFRALQHCCSMTLVTARAS